MDKGKSPDEILAGENQGRPPIQMWGTTGMVSSMHPEATQAAVDVLRAGGNAVDAAVALGATLAVTNANLCGLGGDSAWLIYWARTGEYFYIDGYSKCAQGISLSLLEHHFHLSQETTPEAYREEPPMCRHEGIIVANVPGTPAAWTRTWESFGTLPLSAVLSRAIDLAEYGVPVNRFLAADLEAHKSKLGKFPSSRTIFFKTDADLLSEGDMLVQKDLAETLKRLAANGYSEFYRGTTAKMMARYAQAHGGVLTLKDFADYDVVWRPACKSRYRGFDVIVTGPPTSGIHMLQELLILGNFDMEKLGYHSARALHVMIEAAKLARADRRNFAGDPDFVPIPVEHLLDIDYARERAKLIQFGVARCARQGVPSTRESTTHFVVMDREGNIVSATQTSAGQWGCGEVVEGTGIVMNDRTWWMALKDSPNIVSPGRRANIGHSPTIVLDNGKPFMALGSPGGDGIIQYIMQTIVNVIDYGFDIQDAIEAPRFRSIDLCYQVGMERRIDQKVQETLKSWGHQLIEYPEWTMEVGGVEGCMVNRKTGAILGGYDPRRNSMASGISGAMRG